MIDSFSVVLIGNLYPRYTYNLKFSKKQRVSLSTFFPHQECRGNNISAIIFPLEYQ